MGFFTAQRACNTTTEFLCQRQPGRCIPNSWLCDGEKDCSEGEDELPTAGCGEPKHVTDFLSRN